MGRGADSELLLAPRAAPPASRAAVAEERLRQFYADPTPGAVAELLSWRAELGDENLSQAIESAVGEEASSELQILFSFRPEGMGVVIPARVGGGLPTEFLDQLAAWEPRGGGRTLLGAMERDFPRLREGALTEDSPLSQWALVASEVLGWRSGEGGPASETTLNALTQSDPPQTALRIRQGWIGMILSSSRQIGESAPLRSLGEMISDDAARSLSSGWHRKEVCERVASELGEVLSDDDLRRPADQEILEKISDHSQTVLTELISQRLLSRDDYLAGEWVFERAANESVIQDADRALVSRLVEKLRRETEIPHGEPLAGHPRLQARLAAPTVSREIARAGLKGATDRFRRLLIIRALSS